MEKRFFVALLLAAIVVAVTPMLFPGAPRPESVIGDSLSIEKVEPTEETRISQPRAALPALPDRITDSVTAGSLPLAQTTTVETTRGTYRFTSMGAAPVSIALHDYANLGPRGGKVELETPESSLLSYSVLTGRDTIQLSEANFRMTSEPRNGNGTLSYEAVIRGMAIRVSYEFVSDNYLVTIKGTVLGAEDTPYLLIGLPSTLPPAESDTVGDLRSLAYSFKPVRDNASSVSFGKLDPGERHLQPGPLSWVAVKNKYFVVGLLNPEGSTFDEIHLSGGPRVSKIPTHTFGTIVKSIRDGSFEFEMYAGPQQSTELRAIGRDFEHVNPYGWTFFQGVVQPIATLCLQALLWMHSVTQLSYGWVLVIFGVMIRIILWPLNQRAMRSGLKMQEIQPRLAEVQKKFKDKPEKQREEMMRVYRETGTSPFTAVAGCLPMLIPMPVLFALFFVFQNTIEFRGVSFLWLGDISVKDPYYALPVLMGASAYVLSWIGLRNAPPNPQAKMMSYMFPVMMTFFLANMAAGLNLYYTSQNIAALPQQWLIAKERARLRKAQEHIK